VEALDHVKLFGVRRPESVHKRSVVESNRVDDKRIALVTADGFAVPGCLDVLRMLVRQIDAANVIEAFQYHHHFLRPLNDIDAPRHRREQERSNANRPATRVRGESGPSGEDKLVAPADRLARPGLEDRIVGIAYGKGRLPSGNAVIVVGNVRM